MINFNLKAWILILVLFSNFLFISNEDYEDEDNEDYDDKEEDGDDDDNDEGVSANNLPQFNHDNCYNRTNIFIFDNYACISQSKCCNLIEFTFEGGRFNKENFAFSLYMPRLINIFFLIMIPFISSSLLMGCFLGLIFCHFFKKVYSPKYTPVNSFCEQYTTTSRRPYHI
jgi:hypothetical protein